MRFADVSRVWVLIVMIGLALRCTTCDMAGASVTLAWDRNSEPDLAGYKIYYGASSRTYPFVLDVGNATTQVIANLQEGAIYYFAATAYNRAGLESDLSEEVSYTVPLPSITAFEDGSFRIYFKGLPGFTYRIQYSESLSGSNWRSLGSRTADSMGFFEIVDRPPAGSPTRFYRAVYP